MQPGSRSSFSCTLQTCPDNGGKMPPSYHLGHISCPRVSSLLWHVDTPYSSKHPLLVVGTEPVCIVTAHGIPQGTADIGRRRLSTAVHPCAEPKHPHLHLCGVCCHLWHSGTGQTPEQNIYNIPSILSIYFGFFRTSKFTRLSAAIGSRADYAVFAQLNPGILPTSGLLARRRCRMTANTLPNTTEA